MGRIRQTPEFYKRAQKAYCSKIGIQLDIEA